MRGIFWLCAARQTAILVASTQLRRNQGTTLRRVVRRYPRYWEVSDCTYGRVLPAQTVCVLPTSLLLRIERMLRFIEELVLQAQATLIGLHSPNDLRDRIYPPIHLESAKLPGGQRAVAGIMIGESSVPPDPGIDAVRQVDMALVAARFTGSSVNVHQIWPRDHHFRSLAFASVHVESIPFSRAACRRRSFIKNINNVIVPFV